MLWCCARTLSRCATTEDLCATHVPCQETLHCHLLLCFFSTSSQVKG